MEQKIFLGKTSEQKPIELWLNMANRHGLITGATGTGKTVTLQTMAEQFARQGVSVFLTDIKGDLHGICKPSDLNQKVKERVSFLQISDFSPVGNKVNLWDVFGEKAFH